MKKIIVPGLVMLFSLLIMSTSEVDAQPRHGHYKGKAKGKAVHHKHYHKRPNTVVVHNRHRVVAPTRVVCAPVPPVRRVVVAPPPPPPVVVVAPRIPLPPRPRVVISF